MDGRQYRIWHAVDRALATGWLGLSFGTAFLSILIANIVGGVLLAIFSTFGVDYGLPQMIQGATWFGKLGQQNSFSI